MKSSEERIIKKLESSDRVGDGAEALSILFGVATGPASASTVAAAAGVTTIPILTSAAGWLGLTVVTATPVGWLVGAAMAGGLVVFGAGKLIRSGGRNDQIRRDIAQRLKEKLKKRKVDNCVLDLDKLRTVLQEALDNKSIKQHQFDLILQLVEARKLPINIALARLRALIGSQRAKKKKYVKRDA